MKPLTINKELVLMFTLRQLQDCYKIIMASKKEKKKENIYTCLKNSLNNNVRSSVHYGGSHRGKASAQIPFIQWDLAAPVVEGACDVNLFPSSSPADHGGSSLRTRLYHVI